MPKMVDQRGSETQTSDKVLLEKQKQADYTDLTSVIKDSVQEKTFTR